MWDFIRTIRAAGKAVVALSEARTNYTQALFDYAVALAALEKAVGLSGEK